MPTPTLPITFDVLRRDEPAPVTLSFADNTDVVSTTRWRVPRELDHEGPQRIRAADAREFAILAAKRWRHYRDSDTAALCQQDLETMIAAETEGEYCFHLKVTADWFGHSLGGAMVRRTWCHHLMIDFLFVHPRISGRVESIKGVGIGIMQGICAIARDLHCKRVWGEATRDSASFYQRQLGRSIEDSFTLDAAEIDTFASQITEANPPA